VSVDGNWARCGPGAGWISSATFLTKLHICAWKDGLVIGIGNSIGRLDRRLTEVVSIDFIDVCIRRNEGAGPILIVRTRRPYPRRIDALKP
jgi:hypothetical protein